MSPSSPVSLQVDPFYLTIRFENQDALLPVSPNVISGYLKREIVKEKLFLALTSDGSFDLFREAPDGTLAKVKLGIKEPIFVMGTEIGAIRCVLTGAFSPLRCLDWPGSGPPCRRMPRSVAVCMKDSGVQAGCVAPSSPPAFIFVVAPYSVLHVHARPSTPVSPPHSPAAPIPALAAAGACSLQVAPRRGSCGAWRAPTAALRRARAASVPLARSRREARSCLHVCQSSGARARAPAAYRGGLWRDACRAACMLSVPLLCGVNVLDAAPAMGRALPLAL